MNVADDSSDLNFFSVADGTIFTLEEDNKCTDDSSPKKSKADNKPTYGYLGLLVFTGEYWRKLRSLNVRLVITFHRSS